VIQATSPYHAKEAYLSIGRTMQAAGFSTLPFHDNVPSFGDWGWYLAWDNKTPKNNILKKINELKTFEIQTSYLTADVFRKALIFGKNELKTSNTSINTLMNPTLFHIYTKNSWLDY